MEPQDHGTIESRDPHESWSATPDPEQDIPKITPGALERCPNAFE